MEILELEFSGVFGNFGALEILETLDFLECLELFEIPIIFFGMCKLSCIFLEISTRACNAPKPNLGISRSHSLDSALFLPVILARLLLLVLKLVVLLLLVLVLW